MTKAQSSVEYLMVFGWAFTVIIIVIIALVVMVNPSQTDTEKCSNLKTILLTNFAATDDNFTAIIVNSTGKNISNMQLTLTGNIGETGQQNTLTLTGVFPANDKNAFIIPYSSKNKTGKYEFDITINYINGDNFSITETAKCKGKIISTTGKTSTPSTV
jgi:hypothetical protein